MINKKVLIMAGGTGGHVFPGLELAREFIVRNMHVQWLGTQAGIESDLVPKAGLHLHVFPVSGIRGKGFKAKLLAPFNILISIWVAVRIIRKIKPNIIVGMGGFVAGPGGIAAKLLRIPLVIHEQNAVLGTTNRLLSRLANIVFLGFPLPLPNAFVVGNPVRNVIEQIEEPDLRSLSTHTSIRVLVLGGSRGALALNTHVPQILSLVGKQVELDIWHQCGAGKEESAQLGYEHTALNVKIEPFISDMVKAYRWADFVVCRSGALTVAEISTVGIGALFIPYPYAIDNHQKANAQIMRTHGAAFLVEESDLNIEKQAKDLIDLFQNRTQLKAMAAQSRKLAYANSAIKIADKIEELIDA